MSEKLNRAAALYKDGLPEGDFAEFPLDAADAFRTGVKLMRSGLSRDGGPFICGMGYGMTNIEAAVSARGELFEMIALGDTASTWERERGTHGQMRDRKGNVLDPYELVLPAGLENVDQRVFEWTTVERLSDGETFWAPIEFVISANRHLPLGYEPITPAISNGNGAGDSVERAVVHGLLELCQRDGNAASFRALDQGVVIDNPPLDQPTRDMLEALQARGMRIIFKLAGTSLGVPSIYAIPVLDGQADEALAITACGEAADPDLTLALRKAALEALAARARKVFSHGPAELSDAIEPPAVRARAASIDPSQDEPRAVQSMLELLSLSPDKVRVRLEGTVTAERARIDAASIPSRKLSTNPEERLEHMKLQLREESLEAYTKVVRQGDAVAAKVIVPRIEMELGSFERLGVRGALRLLEREDPLLKRTPSERCKRLTLRPAQEQEIGGPAYLDTDLLEELTGPLYFLYREPTPGSIRALRASRSAA
jgi:ribosomal protein S12 methylthiotransferase accessory factor